MWGLNIIADWPSTTEGVETSHLKLIRARGFKLSFSNPTSWNTTSLNTQRIVSYRNSNSYDSVRSGLLWGYRLLCHGFTQLYSELCFSVIYFWCYYLIVMKAYWCTPSRFIISVILHDLYVFVQGSADSIYNDHGIASHPFGSHSATYCTW